MIRLSLLCTVVSIAAANAQAPAAAEHLLRGAEHFRDARFAEALVEFRVAERRGAGAEAAWYAAAALLKLGRYEEAVETFARAERADPAAGDVLLDYYRAVACFSVRLYDCAQSQLARVLQHPGPRVTAEAQRLQARVAAARAEVGGREAVDAYLDRGLQALTSQRPFLGLALLAEGVRHSERTPDGYRREALRAALDRAEQAARTAGAEDQAAQ